MRVKVLDFVSTVCISGLACLVISRGFGSTVGLVLLPHEVEVVKILVCCNGVLDPATASPSPNGWCRLTSCCFFKNIPTTNSQSSIQLLKDHVMSSAPIPLHGACMCLQTRRVPCLAA